MVYKVLVNVINKKELSYWKALLQHIKNKLFFVV